MKRYYDPKRDYRTNPETPAEIALRLNDQRRAVRRGLLKAIEAFEQSQRRRERIDDRPIGASLYPQTFRYAAA